MVCCDGLAELPNMHVQEHICTLLFGFAWCSACGDGACDDWENPCNCPDDCGPCVGESEAIPTIVDPPPCCVGLELIPPKEPDWFGIIGYCTALCGDGVCDPEVETNYNCPEDCPCVAEGEAVPVIANPPPCCEGLELIPPKYPRWFGIHGYCTALCGDGVCNPDIETSYNCPVDCQRRGHLETRPMKATR